MYYFGTRLSSSPSSLNSTPPLLRLIVCDNSSFCFNSKTSFSVSLAAKHIWHDLHIVSFLQLLGCTTRKLLHNYTKFIIVHEAVFIFCHSLLCGLQAILYLGRSMRATSIIKCFVFIFEMRSGYVNFGLAWAVAKYCFGNMYI